MIPEDLRYTAEHEWVRRGGGRVRVGITDYAQDALGDIVFVQLPEAGHGGAGRASPSARSSRPRASPRSTRRWAARWWPETKSSATNRS